MASRCGCGSAQCSCAVIAGTGITVSGVGSASNPYVITASGAALTITDTPSLNLTLSGSGTPASPWVLSGVITPSSTSGNLVTLDGNGVLVASSAVRDAVGAAVGNGLAYVSGTGSLVAKISADSGNVLSIGTDGGLLSPAATTVVAAPVHLSNTTGNTLLDGKVGGDTVPRIFLVADGPIRWADGANPWDSNLYRAGVGILRTDGSLIAGTGFTAQTSFITSAVTGTFGTADRRWAVGPDSTAEGGANVGSLFQIARYSDTGALLDTPFQIDRSNGRVYVGGIAGTSGAGLVVQRAATGMVLGVTNTAAGGSGILITSQDTASSALAAQVTGDTTGRWRIGPGGDIGWGTGSAVRDTFLARTAAGILTLTGSLVLTGALTVPGIGGSASAVKTADTPRISTTALAADPHLAIAVTPGTYRLTAMLVYEGDAAADLKLGWTAPAGTTGAWWPGGPDSSMNALAYATRWGASSDVGATNIPVGCIGAGSVLACCPVGTVIVTTAGTLTLAWAQQVSTAVNTILHAGSWMTLQKIA